MRLLPDEDEREFAATLRRILTADHQPSTLWKALADAGVFGLSLPSRYGGSDAGLTPLGAFYVEGGRYLCPTIVHGTIHAGLAVHALGTADQHAALLPGLADGRVSATTALWHPNDAGNVTATVTVVRSGDTWRLGGSVDFVLDARVADELVVAAKDGGRTMVFVVPMTSVGLRVEALTLMGGQHAAQLHFDDVAVKDPLRVLGGETGVTDRQLHSLADTASALLSLDLVGVGEAALQRTVDHTRMRHQFGRPIGSFQAAQHLVADMHIALAAARLAAWAAVAVLQNGADAARETAVARMHAAGAAKLATLDAHQLHGGIGYVVDTDLHRYSERARVLSTLGGGADVAATWLEGRNP